MDRKLRSWVLRRLRRIPKLEPESQPQLGLMLALASEPDHPYLSFGIGCFHFGARPDRFDGNAQQFVADIQQWLQSLDSVSNVVIRDPEISWWENDLPPGLADGGRPYPAITRLLVEFDLVISSRAQARLAFFGAPQEPLTVRVSIRQGPAVPIAFVVPDAARERPSLAVSLVLATLKELVPADASFFVDARGPSPPFVEFFLVPFVAPDQVAPQGWPFVHSRIDQPIGNSIDVFAYDPRRFGSLDEAAPVLFSELELLAGVYYEIVGAGRRLALDWSDLDELREYLLDIESRAGIRGWLRRQFTSSGVLRELAVGLAEFEAELARQLARSAEIRRDMDVALAAPALLPEIDEAIREDLRFDSREVERPLQLFEQRRLTRAQNTAAVAGAVLAAAIGASAALVISQPSSSPVVTVKLQTAALTTTGVTPTITRRAPPASTTTATTGFTSTLRTHRPAHSKSVPRKR